MFRKLSSFLHRGTHSIVRYLPKGLFFLALYICSFLTAVAQPFYGASVAKRGTGNYKGSIFWVNWDVNDDGRPGENIASGSVRQITTLQGITYRITITKIAGNNNNISSYAPGQYSYDDLKTGYNWFTQAVNSSGPTNTSSGYTGGYNFTTGAITSVYDNLTDAHNSIIGIANSTAGQRVNFRISVTATLNGTPVSILGMVAVGAESLGYSSTSQETEAFTTNGDSWQAFERIQNNYQGSGRSTSFVTRADISNSGRTVLDKNPGVQSPSEGPGAMLWFSKNANQIDVDLKGGGKQAIAIGFVGVNDFGDAPISYGTVSHQLDVIFNGGSVPVANNVVLNNIALATQSAPLTSLGTAVDIDADQFYSANLMGDDDNGLDDEDALANPYSTTVVYGANNLSVTVPVRNNANFPVRLWGWVDINLDGIFQANERTGPLNVAGNYSGNVNLSFTGLPASFAAFKQYPLRLRLAQALPADIGATANVDESSFGIAASGEVEDHLVKVPEAPVSGKIFEDVNKNKVLDGGEVLYSGTDMFVYIVDADNKIVAKANVVNGNYTIYSIPANANITSLNAKIVATTQNLSLGTTLTGGAPSAGYEITGEDITQAGANANTGTSNNDFVIHLLGTVPLSGIQNANFGMFPRILAVNFGAITGRLSGDKITIDWTTLMEENNDHFIIELSRDGKLFHTVGRVNSLAAGGNSDSAVNYHFSLSLSQMQQMQLPLIAALLSLFVMAGAIRKRKLALVFFMVAGLGILSCSKTDAVDTGNSKNYFLRISQVDKDGSFSSSKIVKVIVE